MDESKIKATGNLAINSGMADLTLTTASENTSLNFDCGDNKELVLTYKDGKLEISGDGDMNEAAKSFFKHFLKPMADAYVTSMLK